MEPQRERLPPWVTTYLDDMKVAGEIDPASTYVLMLYGDRRYCADRAESFGRRNDHPPEERFDRFRTRLVNELTAHADTLIPHVPEPVWAAILRSSVLDFQHNIRETAEWLCGWAVEDACEGGASLPFRRPPRAGLARSWWPTKKVRRRLMSPRFMRRYMSTITDIPRYVTTAQRLTRLMQGHRIGTLEEEAAFFDLLETQANSTIPEPDYRRDLLAWAERQGIIKVVRGRRKKLLRRARQKRLKRAALFAASLLGNRAVGAFIRNECVEVAGRDLTFLVGRQANNLDQCGHGCLNLAARATEGSIPLGVFCFYIEDTPVLDQLAAIALHTEAGTEREILSVANIIIPASAGMDHPFMVERRAAALAEALQAQPVVPRNPAYYTPNGRVVARLNYDPRQLWGQRREWYLQETREQWESIFKTALFGKHLKWWNSITIPPREVGISPIYVGEDLPLVA